MIALVLAAVLGAADCDPQEKPACAADDPTLCAKCMNAGDRAPFAGQILTTPLSIKIAQKANSCDTVTKIEVEHATQKLEIDLGLERKLRGIDRQAHDEAMAVVGAELEEARAAAYVPIYRRPWFVATGTAILTAAITAGVIKATN